MKISSIDDARRFLVATQCVDLPRSTRKYSVDAYFWSCQAARCILEACKNDEGHNS